MGKLTRIERKRAALAHLEGLAMGSSYDPFPFDPRVDTCCTGCKYAHDPRYRAMIRRSDRRQEQIANLKRKLGVKTGG